MKKTNINVRHLTEAGIIAALYGVLTLCFAPLSFGPLQLRISEALTILPILTPAAVPGLAVGCLIANMIGMGMGATLPIDLIFGTLATLLAACLTRQLRGIAVIKDIPVLSILAPVLVNGVIVGMELSIFFGSGSFFYCFGAVSLGELIIVCTLGVLLLLSLRKSKQFIKQTYMYK